MITYNDIYEALRKERYSEQLQPLPKNFISEIAAYLEDKKKIASKGEDLFSDVIIKTKKQLENAISIFKELMLRRKKKLLDLTFIAAETGISKRDFDNMMAFEKDLFDKIMQAIKLSEKDVNGLLNGESEQVKIVNKMITFKEDVEEFVNARGEKMGPYKKGDISNLPEEIVKILASSGKVVIVGE